MRTRTTRRSPRLAQCLLASGVLASAACPALAQADDDVLFDLDGMRMWCELFGVCFPDQSRNSADHPLPPGTPQTILPADGYRYTLDGTVRTSGAISLIIPDGSSLAEMMDTLQAGQSRMLTGYMRNPTGGLPDAKNTIWLQTFADEILGLELAITLEASISDQGVALFEIRDIDISLGILFGDLRVENGTCLIETWTPSPRQETEWHFDGALDSVANSGPARLDYLDNPAFGTVLGGIGNEDNPNPSAPTGVTEAQSSFSTTTSLGIDGPGGEDATVYVTSPARNLADPDPDLYRGIGLALFPSSKPEFPGGFLGQWTIIYDLYIPADSWNTEWPVALVHGSHNNNGRADCLVRNPGNGNGAIGYIAEPGDYVETNAIGPDRWMRIALVSNFMQTNETAIYVDGQLVGTTNSDWHYNSVDPNAPAFGDGEPVDSGDWTAWGEFPSPWALSTGSFPDSLGPTPLASTLGLFCDLGDADLGPGGRSETVYLANLYFADDMLSPAEIAALGGTDADGIVFTAPPCAADFNTDGFVDTRDVIAFLNAWNANEPEADFNDDGFIDTRDVIAFLNAWNAGC